MRLKLSLEINNLSCTLEVYKTILLVVQPRATEPELMKFGHSD